MTVHRQLIIYSISISAEPVIFLRTCVKDFFKLTNLICLVLDSGSFYKKTFSGWKVKVYIWRIKFSPDEKN